ncbi:FIG01027944: hypothetical protein [hydrothermal vent metagenome]|uniref:Uncharacterized protein n=1 Tax=hydrothermal vent metagenome TaxID=652676 RepID=A0A3B0Z123_9ZZZZ
MKPCVFIHTNHKQIVGAYVAEHALRRYSKHNDKFEVKFIQLKDYAFFNEHEGCLYLRDGMQRPWLNNDLQSFTPLRFMPPELMGYESRSIIIDPDIFAVSDIWDLLSHDMQGKAIMCRPRTGTKGRFDRCLASSVMLLDNTRLSHWKVEHDFNEMFEGARDYMNWICLKTEPRESISLFENEWNDFDKLTPRTRMLHTTKRKTQPWKTGLPIDYRPREKFPYFPPLALVMKARRKLFGEYAFLGHYKSHPDPNQQNLFFGLLKECIDAGTVTEDMLREQIAQNHVRHDAFEVIDQTPPLVAA